MASGAPSGGTLGRTPPKARLSPRGPTRNGICAAHRAAARFNGRLPTLKSNSTSPLGEFHLSSLDTVAELGLLFPRLPDHLLFHPLYYKIQIAGMKQPARFARRQLTARDSPQLIGGLNL